MIIALVVMEQFFYNFDTLIVSAKLYSVPKKDD